MIKISYFDVFIKIYVSYVEKYYLLNYVVTIYF